MFLIIHSFIAYMNVSFPNALLWMWLVGNVALPKFWQVASKLSNTLLQFSAIRMGTVTFNSLAKVLMIIHCCVWHVEN